MQAIKATYVYLDIEDAGYWSWALGVNSPAWSITLHYPIVLLPHDAGS